MVTGTARSSGPASIITAVQRLARARRREIGEEFGVAGIAEAGVVEHLLGDRRGDDRRGAPGEDVADGAVDRFDDARRVPGVRLSRTVAEAVHQRHDRQ